MSSSKRYLRIGITEAIPWSYRNENQTWEGICIDIIDKLANIMDFDYKLVLSVDEDTMPPESINKHGIIANLVTKETDLIIAAVSMTAAKGELIEYITPPFDYSGLSIVTRKPMGTSSFFKFLTVLSFDVWLSIIIAVFVTAVVFWILEKFSEFADDKKKNFTLKESLWFAITTFTFQGNGNVSSGLPQRILISAYWVFVLIMMTTFTANMAAFLTVERLQTPISSLWELARQTRIKFTVVENSHAHSYFRNMKHAEDTLFEIWKDIALTHSSKNEFKYRIWDYPIREGYRHALALIERNKPVVNADYGFREVLENEQGFALIHDTAEIRYRASRDCRLVEVGEIFGERSYSIAVSKNSTLKREISTMVLDLQEQRYFESLGAKYLNSSKIYCDDDEADRVTLENLGGVFISTFFGIILAFLMLAWEISYKTRKKTKIQRIDVTKHFHRSNSLKNILQHQEYKKRTLLEMGNKFTTSEPLGEK